MTSFSGEGRVPPEGRSITFANPADGKLYEFSIVQFVILQTARALERNDGTAPDPRAISEASGACAIALAEDGWFTAEEYAAAWAASEAEDLDEELKRLQNGDA